MACISTRTMLPISKCRTSSIIRLRVPKRLYVQSPFHEWSVDEDYYNSKRLVPIYQPFFPFGDHGRVGLKKINLEISFKIQNSKRIRHFSLLKSWPLNSCGRKRLLHFRPGGLGNSIFIPLSWWFTIVYCIGSLRWYKFVLCTNAAFIHSDQSFKESYSDQDPRSQIHCGC